MKFLQMIRRPRLLTGVFAACFAYVILQAFLPISRALLISFDIGVLVFVSLMLSLMTKATTDKMVLRARIQDEGKWTVLLVSVLVAVFVLGALSSELHAAKNKSMGDIVLASATIFLAWLYVAFTFSQLYAHTFYTSNKPLSFPGTERPDYWDFLYFSLVLSMCCQTSDVVVNDSSIRKIVLLQSVLSFFFNVIIISITVNVVAGVL